MDLRGSVAESEHYDEAAMRRIDRPPDLPFPEVAHEAIPHSAPPLEGHPMLGDPSTSIGLQFAPQPTSFVPFEFNQQLEGPAGYIQAQNADLPEDIQRELAEAELRHEAARYQILEKAKTFPASSHSRETTTSYPYVATEETAKGYTGAYNHLNMPVHPPQIPHQGLFSNDSGSTSVFEVQLETGQELSQPVVYPYTLHDGVQGAGQRDNTFPTAQDLDYNAFGHSTYGQQPAIDSMAFATSHYSTMPFSLSPYDQGYHLSSFVAPPQSQLTQPSLLLRDFGAVPVTASQLPTNTTNNLVFGTTDPSANLPMNSIINPSAGCSFPRTMDDPLSFSATGHSTTSDIATTSTIGPLVPVGAIRQTGRPAKWRKGVMASPYDRKKGPRPGREMENVFLHTDPVADRRRLKDLPKSREVTDKAPSSCFGCRLSKRKCTVLTGDVCLQCQNILKRYTDRTAIPKFTCIVRTSFPEMWIAMNPSLVQLSGREICDKLRFASSRPPNTVENDGIPATTRSFSDAFLAAKEATLKVLHRVRNLLDLLEPLHFRRMFPLDSDLAVLWSYSFSMMRWKNAIRVFWSDLQDVLESHEYFHRFLTLVCLVNLDVLLVSKTASKSFLLLNIYCEGISAVEDTATVEYAARQHTLVALRHHIFHVYRKMFSKISTHNKHERDSDKLFAGLCYQAFPRTSELLPEGYQSLPYMSFIQILNQNLSQGRWLTYREPLVTTNDPTGSQDSLRQKESLFRVEAYLPAEIAAIFGISKARLDCYEEMYQNKLLAGLPEPSKLEMLHLSQWSLSLGFRVFLDEFDFENGDEPQIDVLLEAILLSSFTVLHKACEFHLRRGALMGSLDLWELAMTDRVALEAFLIQSIAGGEEASLLVAHGILKRRPGKISTLQPLART